MKTKRLMLSTTLGIAAIAGLTAISQPVSAANVSASACTGADLGPVLNLGNSQTTFQTNCTPVTQLGIVQGRSGTNGPRLNGDYEVGISKVGANVSGGVYPVTMQLNWDSGVTYNWLLTWNPGTDIAQFSVTNPPALVGAMNPISFQFSNMPFNAFGIETRADDPSTGIITAGATMNLKVTDIALDGGLLLPLGSPLSVTSTSGTTRFDQNFYVIDGGTEFTQLAGTFIFNDNGGLNPQDLFGRSRGIGFKITLYDPPAEPATNDSASVPEPNAVFGLGILSLGAFFKRKFAEKKQQDNTST